MAEASTKEERIIQSLVLGAFRSQRDGGYEAFV